LSKNPFLSQYISLAKYPFGKKLFSMYFAHRVPYFKSISPLMTHVDQESAEVLIKKRRRVFNHLKTVHAIAIANGLEMAMGGLAEASIPKHLRWIPKGMRIQYTTKATTDIRCVATIESEWQPGDYAIKVTAYDNKDNIVTDGYIDLWVSEKPSK